jgi:hypothetical protein
VTGIAARPCVITRWHAAAACSRAGGPLGVLNFLEPGFFKSTLGAACLTCATVGTSGVMSGPASALTGPPSVTLSGSFSNSHGSPDSNTFSAVVNARLRGSLAGGSLTIADPHGESEGTYERFEGKVTCIRVAGNRVTVGAFGAVTRSTRNGVAIERSRFAGSDTLDIEFGEFFNDFEENGKPLTFEYEGGPIVEGRRPTRCPTASFSELSQARGALYISPSITSPQTGLRSRSHAITLSGTGEPKRPLDVYEAGHKSGGTDVTPGVTGEWSLTLTGLGPGRHIFQASALGGSTVASNAVEVVVT